MSACSSTDDPPIPTAATPSAGAAAIGANVAGLRRAEAEAAGLAAATVVGAGAGAVAAGRTEGEQEEEEDTEDEEADATEIFAGGGDCEVDGDLRRPPPGRLETLSRVNADGGGVCGPSSFCPSVSCC